MLSWSCEALCNRVQAWWCFKTGKVDGGGRHVANIFEMDMELKWEISPSLAEVSVWAAIIREDEVFGE